MHIDREDVTTTDMPYISSLLKKELPTILRSKCFNEGNVPFYKEVLSTELGHLFEHILLEYLCMAKIGMGFKEAVFSGITKWDWNKDPYGTFRIEIDVDNSDLVFLTPALKKTINLFESILIYPTTSIAPRERTKGVQASLLR
ncbi:MAG TPA: hypothetical protein VF941_15530 [Clostridia bacterium]